MSFGFANIKHAFAWVAEHIAKGMVYVEEAEPIVEGVTMVLDPPAVVVERAAFAALGSVLGQIHQTAVDGQSLVDAKGLNVVLDQQEISDFLQVWQLVQTGLVSIQALSKNVPAPTLPKV